MKNLKNSLVIAFIFVNSVFGQSRNYKSIEYKNEKYRYELRMDVPKLSNIPIESFFNDKFERDREELEKYQKNRDKSYYSEQAVNIPYTINYSIDTVFKYVDRMSVVYRVIEENATPGLEDYYYEIYNFRISGKNAEPLTKIFFYERDKVQLVNLIEEKVKCKILEDVELHKYMIVSNDDSFWVLIWKGLLDIDYANCANLPKWIEIEKNSPIYKLLFSTKKVKRKSYLYLEPNIKTKMYLIKDDKVEIIEEKDNWLKIRYYGKKVIEGWIKRSDVE